MLQLSGGWTGCLYRLCGADGRELHRTWVPAGRAENWFADDMCDGPLQLILQRGTDLSHLTGASRVVGLRIAGVWLGEADEDGLYTRPNYSR